MLRALQRIGFAFTTLVFAGCTTQSAQQLGLVTAKDLAGTYTGVLQGLAVSQTTGLVDPNTAVIVDYDLLHKVTATATGTLNLAFESNLISRFTSLIVGYSTAAINLDFVNFDGLDLQDPTKKITGLTVKQLIFVKRDTYWVFVLQLNKTTLPTGTSSTTAASVYQYVSYPPDVAQAMSQNDAIVYINDVFRLVSAAERMH